MGGIFDPLITWADGWALWFGTFWIYVQVVFCWLAWMGIWALIARYFEGMRPFAGAMMLAGTAGLYGYYRGRKSVGVQRREQRRQEPPPEPPRNTQPSNPFDWFWNK